MNWRGIRILLRAAPADRYCELGLTQNTLGTIAGSVLLRQMTQYMASLRKSCEYDDHKPALHRESARDAILFLRPVNPTN
jgi:hypothetical protein